MNLLKKFDSVKNCGCYGNKTEKKIENFENLLVRNHPQLSGGIEIAQLSHYSRGTTPPLCLPVCRGLRPVSPDDGILVVE